ncbi:conserved exported hypothetical protein [uncultured Defluviicoccus sp.]|uniref:Lipoprotein n=1 Tax=metagenome TaxID=256318 RepID=A0A380TKV2_9ZZZZ|nr:conserved exported hypothetical protein [uncultured Defluviicoccus sp.]
MRILRSASALALVAVAGCHSVGLAARGPSADTRGWTTHRIEVGAHIVQFTIPPGESQAFRSFSIPTRVDLADPDAFDEVLAGPVLLRRTWDYRESRFDAVDGSLSAGISVSRSNHPLESLDSLRAAVENASELNQSKLLREEGRRRASNKPVSFEAVKIAGRDAWKATYELTGIRYVLPLDERHYLGISLRRNGISRLEWRVDAENAAKAILESIRITP